MATFTNGNITYTVSMELAELLENSKRAQQELKALSNSGTKASKGIDDVKKSASGAGKSLLKLSTIAKAVISIKTINEIKNYADSWITVNNKLANSVKENESLATVTNRVYELALKTNTSLDATATLYSRLEQSTRAYNISAEDLARVTETVNKSFAISGATASEAQGAIIQLSQGLAAGTLRGQEFNTISQQGSRLTKVLADSLKLSAGELKEWANQGKLTTDVVVNAILKQSSTIDTEFGKIETTIGESLTNASTKITQFIGTSTTVKKVTAAFKDSVELLTDNLDALAFAAQSVAAVYAGKYITSLSTAISTQVAKIAGDYNEAKSIKALVAEEMRELEITGRRLTARRAELLAQKAAATSKIQEANIQRQLNQLSKERAALVEREAAAQTRLATVTKLSTVAMNGLKGAMNLLGGPAGILLIAAGAFISFAIGASEARQSAIDLKDNIEDLTESFKKMNKEQREAQIVKLEQRLSDQAEEIKDETTRLNAVLTDIELKKQGQNVWSSFKELNQQLILIKGNLADMQQGYDKQKTQLDDLKQKNDQLANSTDKVTESTKKQNDEFSKNTVENITKNINKLSQELEIAELKQKGLTKEAYIYQGVLSALGDESSKYQSALKGLITGTAEMTDLTDEQQAKLAPLITLLEKMYDVNAQGAPKVKTTAEKLKELKDNLKGLADTLEKENTSYNESAKVLKDSLTNKLISQKDYQAKLEQLETEHQLNLAKIRSDNVVSPQDQAVAQVDPVQALINENARKLALIQEYENQKLLTEQQALALREAANYQYEQNRINAQWEIWRNQSDANDFLASSIEALGSSVTSTMSGLLSGTMTATEAMQNFANVILNEAIGSLVQMGLQYVKNSIVEKTASASTTTTQIIEAGLLTKAYTAAAIQASIATQGAAATLGAAAYSTAMGTMTAASIAGGREHGGTVAGNSMYRVGEGGKPEILMQGGRQYLIPGENGRVLSNREMKSNGSGGNSTTITVNQSITFEGGQDSNQSAQQTAMLLKQAIRNVLQEEKRPGGMIYPR